MNRTVKKILSTKVTAVLIVALVRAYLLLVRFRIENQQQWIRHLEKGGGILLCAFHQQFFSFVRHFPAFRRYDPLIMISRSRDGDIVSSVANLCGWRVTRGSSSRGGKEAMQEIIKHLKTGGCIGANIVDGPTGPIGKVKAGTIRIAQQSGASIVPCFAIAESAWFLGSWDRFMIPKPFSLVTVRYGDMIPAEGVESRETFEHVRSHLESMMEPYLYHGPSQDLTPEVNHAKTNSK